MFSTGDPVRSEYPAFDRGMQQVCDFFRVPAMRYRELDVLRQAAAFITHGGMNSAMEALYHGVPMVAVPMRLEQKAVAERLAELQLGLVVELRNVTSHVLRDAVARLEADPEVRSAVDRMRKAIRGSAGQRRAVDLLLQYASG